jgi:undecaprenyl pyrophosphate phosphatase UppP
MIWATLVAFIVGLLAIHLMYKYLLTNRKNLRWFGAYALILGIVIGITLIL